MPHIRSVNSPPANPVPTTTPTPSPSTLLNLSAQLVTSSPNTTHINDSVGNDNISDCWNEYCWDEDEYQAAIEDYIFPQDFEWFFIALYAYTFFVGLVGNFLVCFAVWRNRNMRNVTNVFIVNLAVGDFLLILLCLPPTLVQNVSLTWFLGAAMCKTLLFLQNTSVSVSVLTLSAIAVERWYAICYPLRFKSTLRRARNIIIIIWIAAMLIALPELIVAETHPFQYPPPFTSVLLTECKPAWEGWKQSIYQIILAIAMYLGPMILMAFTYAHIAYVLWMQEIPGDSIQGQRPMLNGARSNGGTRGSRLPEDQLASRRKAAKMLIAIVIVFAICYLPVHVMNVLRYFDMLTYNGDTASLQPLISHWLPYFNSALNPVIYNFMSAKFRKEFKVACFCCFYCGFRHRPFRRRGDHPTFTMTFSHSNYSNCHTEEITLASLKD